MVRKKRGVFGINFSLIVDIVFMLFIFFLIIILMDIDCGLVRWFLFFFENKD